MVNGKLVALATLAGLYATECRANEYIMIATGTILSGSQVAGYFGGGNGLAGDAVSYSIIYSDGPTPDGNLTYVNNGDVGANYQNQNSPSFIVTIGGTSLTFNTGGVNNGSSSQLMLYKGHSLPVPYGSADSMYAGGYYSGASSTFAEGDISAYAFWVPFLQSTDLDVPETDIVSSLDADIPGRNVADFSFYSPGTVYGLQVQFSMNASEITLAPYSDPVVASVPEPSTLVILSGGLGVVGFAVRKRTQQRAM
jgi:PEP-CTERM motif